MINGKFVCFGSNQHLKDKFGDGYRISIKMSKSNREEVERLISESLPNAKNLKENKTNYLDYQLESRNFSFYEVFSFLECYLKKEHLIEDFSITLCSLDQIFIQFSRAQQSHENN
jgi:hypothetical protein